VNSLAAIDWNGDLDALDNPVSVNINSGGGLQILNGFDDWANIVYNGGSVGHLGESTVLPTVTFANPITEEIDMLIPVDFKVCISGPGKVGLEVCQTGTHEYTITNTGDKPDTFDIATSSSEGYADLSVFPASVALAPGVSAVFKVGVEIPESAMTGTVDEVKIVVASQANPLMLDSAETATEVIAPTDNDGDGFFNFCDACPDSDTSATIVIDGRDSGVANQHLGDGCFMKDLILQAAASSKNHGAFVSKVSKLTNGWKKGGLITGKQKGAIQKAAAKANIPAGG
jgi:hypothetical protein